MVSHQKKSKGGKRSKRAVYERYDLSKSPLAQKPTQRDLAKLVGLSQPDLRRLSNFKEQFIVRREIKTGKSNKVRNLAYPEGLLRQVHEKLKYHLNKIVQPDYLYSPRKNRGQRDNASQHLDNAQYLTLDLKSFYPSTTRVQVQDWLVCDLHMYDDVARLFAALATVDDVVSFGSPLTPVLCTLVHRSMFSEIERICQARGLRMTLWVDDLTISGNFVPGEVLKEIRAAIRGYGHKSHKIKYRTGNRPVFITGIGVLGKELVAPRSLNIKIKESWAAFHEAETDVERLDVAQKLLAQLGVLRHIVGSKSASGRRVSDEMNSLRQKRKKLASKSGASFKTLSNAPIQPLESGETPW